VKLLKENCNHHDTSSNDSDDKLVLDPTKPKQTNQMVPEQNLYKSFLKEEMDADSKSKTNSLEANQIFISLSNDKAELLKRQTTEPS
jgi:hypothetical protein